MLPNLLPQRCDLHLLLRFLTHAPPVSPRRPQEMADERQHLVLVRQDRVPQPACLLRLRRELLAVLPSLRLEAQAQTLRLLARADELVPRFVCGVDRAARETPCVLRVLAQRVLLRARGAQIALQGRELLLLVGGGLEHGHDALPERRDGGEEGLREGRRVSYCISHIFYGETGRDAPPCCLVADSDRQ